ncbi:MAG: hypothetical protein AAFP86_12855, partial [Planctomycetota bacterium]
GEYPSELEKHEELRISISSDRDVWRDTFDAGFKATLALGVLNGRNAPADAPLSKIGAALDELDKHAKALADGSMTVEEFDQKARVVSSAVRRARRMWLSGNFVECEADCDGERRSSWGIDSSASLFAVELLSEYAYLLVKRAKMEALASDPELRVQLRVRWLQVTVVCSVALDLCRQLHPAFLRRESRETIKLQTLYGLALGHLGRPMESNRRFNEAAAVLSKQSRIPDEVETAIIRLRRAEVALARASHVSDVIECLPLAALSLPLEKTAGALERQVDPVAVGLAEHLRAQIDEIEQMTVDQLISRTEENLEERVGFATRLTGVRRASGNAMHADPFVRKVVEIWRKRYLRGDQVGAARALARTLRRLQSALLDDAWVYLESAERLLAGYSQSSLWWGRVAELKLRAYGEVRADSGFDSLVFRRRLQHDVALTRLRDQLLLVEPSSPYAQITCVEVTARAMSAVSSQDFIAVPSFSEHDWCMLRWLLTDALIEIVRDEDLSEPPHLLLRCWSRADSVLDEAWASSSMDLPRPVKREGQLMRALVAVAQAEGVDWATMAPRARRIRRKVRERRRDFKKERSFR